MGSFRFRKSFKIVPGVKLNINKQSLSVTAGVRGAHYTLNSKGYRTASVGLPGTGLSYRDTRKLGVKKPTATQPKAIPAPAVIRERIWSTVINGTELVIEMVVVPGSPDSYDLFVGDGTSWHGIANYDDLHSLAPEAQQWQAYLRNGGTVAAWLETWS